jgi:hypothetical protein
VPRIRQAHRRPFPTWFRSFRAWRETGSQSGDAWSRNLLDWQYESPVRIVAFNTAEGWSRDVTVDIADELRRRYVEHDEVPESVLAFMEATRR